MDILTVQKALRPFLRPLGSSYSLLMRTRRTLFSRGIKECYTPSKPCVAIGNIAWGGTGKTPLTGWFLHWAEKRRLVAAVLTRGYKGKKHSAPFLVKQDTSPKVVGDEPAMLARHYPNAKILAFSQRKVSAKFAEKHCSPDLFILDDGMQHLQVSRHVNLVLLRPEDLNDQWNRVIPEGSWREDESALFSASAFAMKVSSHLAEELRPAIYRRLEKFNVPCFTFDLNPQSLIPLEKFQNKGLYNVKRTNDGAVHKEVFLSGYSLLTAVGAPLHVAKTVTNMIGFSPRHQYFFPDHYFFTEKDITDCCASGLPVICTEKDAVKISAKAASHVLPHIFVLSVNVVFGQSYFTKLTFEDWWEAWWHQHTKTNL